MSYYVVKMMSWVGLASDLREPPGEILDRNRVGARGRELPTPAPALTPALDETLGVPAEALVSDS